MFYALAGDPTSGSDEHAGQLACARQEVVDVQLALEPVT